MKFEGGRITPSSEKSKTQLLRVCQKILVLSLTIVKKTPISEKHKKTASKHLVERPFPCAKC